jgi:hypothetical protein
MPAQSKDQQKAAGMALAARRGEMDPNKLRGGCQEDVRKRHEPKAAERLR